MMVRNHNSSSPSLCYPSLGDRNTFLPLPKEDCVFLQRLFQHPIQILQTYPKGWPVTILSVMLSETFRFKKVCYPLPSFKNFWNNTLSYGAFNLPTSSNDVSIFKGLINNYTAFHWTRPVFLFDQDLWGTSLGSPSPGNWFSEPEEANPKSWAGMVNFCYEFSLNFCSGQGGGTLLVKSKVPADTT